VTGLHTPIDAVSGIDDIRQAGLADDTHHQGKVGEALGRVEFQIVKVHPPIICTGNENANNDVNLVAHDLHQLHSW